MAIFEQYIGGNTRQHHNHGHQQLDESCKKNTGARSLQIRAQCPLCDVLVAAPVVEVQDPLSSKIHGDAGQNNIFLNFQVDGLVNGGSCDFRLWQDHVEMVRCQSHQVIEPCPGRSTRTELVAHNGQGHVGGGKTTDDQHGHLYYIRISNHFHATQGNDGGKKHQHNHDEVEIIATQQAIDGHRSEIKDGSEVHKNVKEQPKNGHDQCY